MDEYAVSFAFVVISFIAGLLLGMFTNWAWRKQPRIMKQGYQPKGPPLNPKRPSLRPSNLILPSGGTGVRSPEVDRLRLRIKELEQRTEQ